MSRGDFDVDSLARYLHVTPDQVVRMAERGNVPARRLGGQWRFSEAEIHHWLEQRIGAANEADLVKVESVLHRRPLTEESHFDSVAELLPADAIAIPLAARTKNSVILAMVELAVQTGILWDKEKMVDAVKAREDLHPTALDNGVALLHPRRPLAQILAQPLLALGVTPHGLPFGESNGQLTDVFFLICSTDDAQHLRILARLSRLIASEGFLTELRNAPDRYSVLEIITRYEEKLSL